MFKQTSMSIIFAAAALILSLPTHLLAFAGGAGTPENPYQISTREDLEAVNNDLEAHYIMINDINLAGNTYTRAVIAPDIFTSTGYTGTPFTGTFNGNGHIIGALNITGVNQLGLFCQIGSSGKIINLGLEDISINGKEYLGGLCVTNEGTINNCYSNGVIQGVNYSLNEMLSGFGGLCGMNKGTIVDSYSSCEVSGIHSAGGLVGSNTGYISNCNATGDIVEGMVEECFPVGDPEGIEWMDCQQHGGGYIGGLCGYNTGLIYNCYAKGSVDTVGITGFWVSRSYGGLCGYNNGSIVNCYSTGYVSNYYSCGLVGESSLSEDSIIEKSFWDVETSLSQTSDGGEGLTTAEMQDIFTFTDAGWDFVNETANGVEDLWQMPAFDYPRLSWEAIAPTNSDIGMLSVNWLGGGCAAPDWCGGADRDFDGSVTVDDLLLLADSWLYQ
ncbi:hypothetical protein SMSP2_01460 [Limihaloglobus sulfuriphilus]|uniref:GLUG domain-containing protein n=2 Tax=Limihaloglobus sulfuriphilus TaxID=1851148 RepID=A0A1Q2MEG8_9BACT|nr:hypothetical protein SMSP2_01460 [Limihaloglobus sulfuriphilus]